MTEEDDDWFESAVEDGDEGETGAAGNDGDSDRPPGGDGSSAESGDAADDSPFEGSDGDTPFGTETDVAFGGDTDTADDSPFEGGGEGSLGGTADGSDSPFADSGDGEGGLFEDDFGSAFESAGGEADLGGDSEFEDEDFDSDIPRIDVGIEGLDGMIQGGIPERHLIVAIGSAGTGKTTFGLQFLHHGLESGENCVFITLEQSHDDIMATANDRGWEFDRYEAEDRLAIVDLDPVEMANSLDNIRGELPDLVEDFDADRLVLDSVSLLEMMYDDQARRRTEVFDFTRSLKAAGVTTMFTSEASETNAYASRHGIIEYLTDAVFVLQYVRSETQETRLAVEIQKIRNANHSRETKPYEITMDGISVYQQANIF
ncbi:KaiC domain-containing protein [Haloarcula litorea]|uniref:KaiC domain-containing protein n=1 Tax=Haloarcula litorea TaxID=3032579 RepID=UPI0023E8685B|nr:KaiC domain-containing protein [Halomicroarcula sp. GDY20]